MAQYVHGTHFLLDEDMKLTLVKAESRGHANLGWLNSFHSFSFGSFYDPSRTHFGTLPPNQDVVDLNIDLYEP